MNDVALAFVSSVYAFLCVVHGLMKQASAETTAKTTPTTISYQLSNNLTTTATTAALTMSD